MPDQPSIADVVPLGDLRASLEAIRDRLARELDEIKWAKHRRECVCICGAADLRALVTVSKELREVMVKLETIPVVAAVESEVDKARAAAAVKNDEMARKRANRRANPAAS